MENQSPINDSEQIIKTLRNEVELLISEAEAVSKKLNNEISKNEKNKG